MNWNQEYKAIQWKIIKAIRSKSKDLVSVATTQPLKDDYGYERVPMEAEVDISAALILTAVKEALKGEWDVSHGVTPTFINMNITRTKVSK
jgi:hypothetical protein